jgi:threonine dehydrogenase-like Zn-dependent dehydrogenase
LSRGTGKYHGFGSEHFSDSTDYLVRVTDEQREKLGVLCVLAEPLSVAWKLVREIETRRGIRKLRDRVLVVGIGPIGMLCLAVFRWMYPGVDLHAADICGDDHQKVKVLDDLFEGVVEFHDTSMKQGKAGLRAGAFDIIIDASGAVGDVFTTMCKCVAPEGILGLLSISDDTSAQMVAGVTAGDLSRIVRSEVRVVGSVCASKEDMEDALHFMEAIVPRPELFEKLIHPALLKPEEAPQKIRELRENGEYLKIVIDGQESWGSA